MFKSLPNESTDGISGGFLVKFQEETLMDIPNGNYAKILGGISRGISDGLPYEITCEISGRTSVEIRREIPGGNP